MPYTPPTGREAKYALTSALAAAAHDFLVVCRGQDLADDQLALEDFLWEVQPLSKNEFALRAKVLDANGDPMNRPAEQFVVTITGGG